MWKDSRSEINFNLHWSNSVDFISKHKTSKTLDDENKAEGRSNAAPCPMEASKPRRDVEEDENGKAGGCRRFPELRSSWLLHVWSITEHRCNYCLRNERLTPVLLLSVCVFPQLASLRCPQSIKDSCFFKRLPFQDESEALKVLPTVTQSGTTRRQCAG